MINLIKQSAVEYKNCYKWTGTITALTTGEFLYLDGDSSKTAPFLNNVSYILETASFTKDLTTGLSCMIEYSRIGRVTKIDNTFDTSVTPNFVNSFITSGNGASFSDPADPYVSSAISCNVIVDGDIIKFEVASNDIPNDCELTLFVFIDNMFDLTDYL